MVRPGSCHPRCGCGDTLPPIIMEVEDSPIWRRVPHIFGSDPMFHETMRTWEEEHIENNLKKSDIHDNVMKMGGTLFQWASHWMIYARKLPFGHEKAIFSL